MTDSLNLPEPKEGMRIVSMIEYRDALYVATERGVYRKNQYDKEFRRLKFEEPTLGETL